MGFIKEELRRQTLEKPQPSAYKGSQWGLTPVGMISHPRSASDVSSNIRSPGSSTPIPSDSSVKRTTNLKLSPIPQSPSYVLGSNEATPRPTREGVPVNASEQDIPLPSSSIVQARPPSPVAVSSPATSSSTSSIVPPISAASPGAASAPGQGNSDYFSLKRRGSTAGQSTPDDFGGWGRPGSIKGREGGVSSPQESAPTAPTTPGGGFMGRLKNLGKTTRRTATDIETPSATVSSSSTAADESDIEKVCLEQGHRPFSKGLPLDTLGSTAEDFGPEIEITAIFPTVVGGVSALVHCSIHHDRHNRRNSIRMEYNLQGDCWRRWHRF